MPRKRGNEARVLIMSASFGGAHAGVANALARYLRAKHSQSVEVQVVDLFEETMPSLNVLARFAYQQDAGTFFPGGVGTLETVERSAPGNPVLSELTSSGLQAVREIVETLTPAAVISTHAVAGAVSAEVCAPKRIPTAVVLSEWSPREEWLHPDSDLVFVACKEAREDLVVRGVAYDRVIVSGVPVMERTSRVDSMPVTRSRSKGGERFTIALSGIPLAAADVAHVVRRLGAAGLSVIAYSGGDPRVQRSLESTVERYASVRVVETASDMHSACASADAAMLGAGGHAVHERLASGLPLIIYTPIPGQETRNVDFLVNSGAALVARDEDDAVEKARFLSSHPGRLVQMAGCARSLSLEGAAQTVCERVLATI